MLEIKVSETEVGLRLDVLLLLQAEKSGNLNYSRSKLSSLVTAGKVTVNSRVVTRPGYKTKVNDFIICSFPEIIDSELKPDDEILLDIVYEDNDLIVINKPPHLVVHPGAGRKSGTLVNGLLAYLGESYANVGHPMRPGIVHRLDAGTSGLMVVAKTETAYQALIKQFLPPRSIHRTYLAICANLPRSPSGVRLTEGIIEKPIARDLKDRKRMSVRLGGKNAKTKFFLESELRFGYLIRLELDTGRTHQIRVHLKSALASIIGDPVYGPVEHEMPTWVKPLSRAISRPSLHAHKLSFLHPTSGERLEFSCPPPKDFNELLLSLK